MPPIGTEAPLDGTSVAGAEGQEGLVADSNGHVAGAPNGDGHANGNGPANAQGHANPNGGANGNGRANGARRAAGGRGRPGGRRLFEFDRRLGVRFVAGADEAGRGCLAGPLVAAAVVFDYERLSPRDVRSLGKLNDSKQHTVEGREELYPLVLRAAARVSVVSRCVRGIDSRGLHVTNLAALRDALARVAVPGCVCLTDGFPVADLGHDQRAVIGGDARSAAIAAASVIAKVTRDRYMRRADELHPGWDFASHVGYSTPEHRDAIVRLGVSVLHRTSFQSVAYQQLVF